MYLKKFLSQPNIVGSLLIALLFSAGVVFAFGFDGFNVQTASEDNLESLLLSTASGCCGYVPPCMCSASFEDNSTCDCPTDTTGGRCVGTVGCASDCTASTNCSTCQEGRYRCKDANSDETLCEFEQGYLCLPP